MIINYAILLPTAVTEATLRKLHTVLPEKTIMAALDLIDRERGTARQTDMKSTSDSIQ
jgi:hypothetical protein